jgi:hypothetical protein
MVPMKRLIRSILRALHRHLFRRPEHVATFKKAIRENEPGRIADGGSSAALETAAAARLPGSRELGDYLNALPSV